MTQKNYIHYSEYIFLLYLQSSRKKEAEKEITFEKKIEKELESGIRNDTIFLGYSFGMTEKEFSKKTDELRQEKKLFINS